MPLEPLIDSENPDLMSKFRFSTNLESRVSGVQPLMGMQGRSPCDSLFPPRVGGQGG